MMRWEKHSLESDNLGSSHIIVCVHPNQSIQLLGALVSLSLNWGK